MNKVYRHSLATRLTHWIAAIALFVLFSSGLQIFNAAPYLDASDKSNPARRVLEIGGYSDAAGRGHGLTRLLGLTIPTTGVFGYTDDGMGGKAARAFPGWLTLPSYQALADGRRWHLFFGWILTAAGACYVIAGLARRDLRDLILTPADLPKLWPMQAYYLRLRREPPHHGKYNPLQKAAYTLVIFVFSPLIVLSGLALSPGVDAMMPPLTAVLGGRQFARLWHFALTVALTGFFFTHVALVLTTGFRNNMRSMISGWYRPGAHEGTGP